MNRIFLISLLLLLLRIVGVTQPTETKTIKIIYKGYIDYNANQIKNPVLDNILMIQGDITVAYQQASANYIPINNDSIKTFINKNMLSSAVYKDYKAQKMSFSYPSLLFDGKPRTYTDAVTPMDWTLTNRTKDIDTFHCIKALTIFRGRAYSAWFSPAININEGPWKFGGLPGLIIELYDEEKNIYWKLNSVTTSTAYLPLPPPSSGDFFKFKREMNNEFQKRIVGLSTSTPVEPGCKTCEASQLKLRFQTLENVID